jgi:sugar phosphate isomerase/epimerase
MIVTRRNFVQGASALAAGMPLLGAAPFTIGVGTFSYHGLSIDDMIAQLRLLNVNQIEMSRGEFMLMHPPTEAMCRSARAKFDNAGIRCVSYYTATIKDKQDIDYAVRYAKLLGASNVSGDATGSALNEIDERFTKEGLTFGIHNHWFPTKFAYESAEDVWRALEGLSPTMGATLDVGQMAACGHDPLDALRLLKSRLKVVHLKDVAAAGAEHNVLFGKGIVNIPAVLHELKAVHFSGLVAIEYEKEGDVNGDMRQQLEFARRYA